MKTKLILFALCTQLLCCVTTETVNPDGSVTKTKRIDIDAFNKGADTITVIATSGK
jgi:hypothetical protein